MNENFILSSILPTFHKKSLHEILTSLYINIPLEIECLPVESSQYAHFKAEKILYIFVSLQLIHKTNGLNVKLGVT